MKTKAGVLSADDTLACGDHTIVRKVNTLFELVTKYPLCTVTADRGTNADTGWTAVLEGFRDGVSLSLPSGRALCSGRRRPEPRAQSG